MKSNKIKYNSHLEINDLIDDAVNNALARRKEALNSEDALLGLSDEEAKNIAGGLRLLDPPTIGLIALPPIITGRIAPPETF